MSLIKDQQQLCNYLSGKQTVAASLLNSFRLQCISAEQGLQIYQSNHLATLTHALRQIYPVCAAIIGSNPFTNICRQYIASHPTGGWSLDLYGEDFHLLLNELCDHREAFLDLAYLPDLAQLEWYWHAAYYADQDRPSNLSHADFSTPAITALCIRPPTGLAVVKTAYPVYSIWQRHRASVDTQTIEGLDQDQHLLILRKDYTVDVHIIEAEEYVLLNACQPTAQVDQILRQFEADRVTRLLKKGWLKIHSTCVQDDCESHR